MKNILCVLLSVCFLTGCKKDITELPAATTTGANTFGLKLDGAFWTPQKFGIAATAPILEARFTGTNGLFINARNFSSSPTETEFEIYIQNITGTGVFEFNQKTGNYPNHSSSYGYYIKRKFMPLGEWITSAQYPGSVTVTRFDTANKIVSGTFEFTAGSTDNSAVLFLLQKADLM